jgi:hypothetical protein
VVPTTSNPPRPSRSKRGSVTQGSPLKSIRLTVTLAGSARGDLGRLAAEKGLAVKEKDGDLSIAFAAATADEALEKLRLLTGLLAKKA